MRLRWYVVLDFSAFLSRRDIHVQNRHAARRATVHARGEGAARENCDASLREMAEARAAAGPRHAKLAGSGGGAPRRIRPHRRHADEPSLNLSSPWNTRAPVVAGGGFLFSPAAHDSRSRLLSKEGFANPSPRCALETSGYSAH